MRFIEQLQDAMKKQIANRKARSQLILQLAQDNANEDCRKIIDALPKENPSLEDMINACPKVVTGSHNMDMFANTITAAVKQTPHCYRCGQQGRVKVNWSHQSIPQGTFQRQPQMYWTQVVSDQRPNMVCPALRPA